VKGPAFLLAIVLLSGCTGWTRSPQPVPAIEQIKKRPQQLRATLLDGTVVTFRSPVVRGDTVFELDRAHGSGRPVPVNQIRLVETKDVAIGPSLAIAAGGFAVLLFVAAASFSPSFGN
jgi:hypothetical protein